MREDARALRYRPEIDGLRALAIVPILLLHAGVTKLRGGFVGVDVFFVISGFLITTIILRDIAAERFSIVRFYRHRIVRILPALLVMMVSVLAIGCMLLLPIQLRDLGKSAFATSAFVSNFYFYWTTNYFTGASKPFIHMWSLAVEEQFYLLYPLLLWHLRRWPRVRLVGLLTTLSLVSFAVGGWMAWHMPMAGFFLLPARVWELSLGALVALGAIPTITNARMRDLLCLGAIGTIIFSCIVIGSGWRFPVPFALPPAIAAATLIAYGEGGTTARLLGAWPLRWIGLISYPIYLWHRPIIAFFEMRYGSTPTPMETVTLIVATLLVAWASYTLVERPIGRHWREGTDITPHLGAIGALVAVAATGLAIAANADRIRPLPPRLALASSYLGWDTTSAGRRQFASDRCFLLPTGRPFDSDTCLKQSARQPNILLIGDSHAAHFSQALRELRPDATILQATAAGCRPLWRAKGATACRDVIDRGFATIDSGRVDTVILSGRWLRFEHNELLETIRFLRARGVRSVLVIGPSVEYDIDLPILIVQAATDGDPGLPARFLITDRMALDREMAGMVRAAGGDYVSAVEQECPGGRCTSTTVSGIPLHFDHSHFTAAGARMILGAILAKHPSVGTGRTSRQR